MINRENIKLVMIDIDRKEFIGLWVLKLVAGKVLVCKVRKL